MSVTDFLATGWGWLILGIALVAIEAVAPGIFMIWFGIAAILTALIDFAFGWSWQANAVAFCCLSIASVLLGWRFTRRRDEEPHDTPMLNRRADALIGRIIPLDQAIVAGEGRVRVDDSVWRVVGPDLPVGTPVRIARVSGTILAVEKADRPPS